jgi:hypothetical protein
VEVNANCSAGGGEIHKRDRQCNINVILRRAHVTSAVVVKQSSVTCSECVCSLRYPACDALVPYCHLWPV